ncbi:hypothetical protein NA56DRAFT_709900 [Hyaloscypha hepaticicola]|uniref:Uncharacterized protein n=1 Tax=Hyaloscypha hepaticicola TaxID=2082293 RepID=A0A2J6PN78_9HELO|nr:hypothetical protein NA56DRAFT_709900 [Hyaloscypha hepaticicola]
MKTLSMRLLEPHFKISTPSREDLIPWSWAITPLASTNRQCPPPAAILGTFAGVNVAATVFGVIIGSRKVSRKIFKVLSCGRFGKEHAGSSQAYRFMWIFPLALNLGTNSLNAGLTVTAKGYDQSSMPRIWDLMLFYCTRPRIGWIPLAFLAFRGADMKKVNPRDGPWTSAGRQSAIAEAILQVIGAYYMGRTVPFGAIHGYFLIHHAEFQNAFTAASRWRYLEAGEENREEDDFSAGLVFMGIFTWIGSWLFIMGYVRLAGDLYCHPSFLSQGAVWTGFNVIGSFLGGGT